MFHHGYSQASSTYVGSVFADASYVPPVTSSNAMAQAVGCATDQQLQANDNSKQPSLHVRDNQITRCTVHKATKESFGCPDVWSNCFLFFSDTWIDIIDCMRNKTATELILAQREVDDLGIYGQLFTGYYKTYWLLELELMTILVIGADGLF